MYIPEVEQIGELKLFRGAIESLKGYIQREISLNGNGKFPPSKIVSHFSFLQQMQNELFHISSLIDSSADVVAEDGNRNLNCTLDDVKIPQSILDDDINIVFETSALSSAGGDEPGSSNEYRSRESFSSMYFSASESLNGEEDRSFYLDNNIRDADRSLYVHEQVSEIYDASGTSELSVEPSPSKFRPLKEVESCPVFAATTDDAKKSAKNAEGSMPTWNEDIIGNAKVGGEEKEMSHPEITVHQHTTVTLHTEEKDIEIEEDVIINENAYAGDEEDDSIVSDKPLPKKYREPTKVLNNTEDDFGNVSFSSTDHLPKQNNEAHEEGETFNEEYIETPPPSPFSKNNSIDAITEAMEAIRINQSNIVAEENVVEASDEIISGYNMTPKKVAKQSRLKQPKTYSSSLPAAPRSPLKHVQL